ncbi:hypothetical protein B841_01990 [Corynebacterium maris DSM 45190]|uniref:Uncharacterized protein n=1 Tax=Corynebacterium maris DSM 45190 TaxID=1224163 RepID=S5TG19_9CORY|nr:hypothetical protein [Corynebacterium maris]AGS33881.1 hypothetical protein B841_01990 [Corynebacterium maris DSM 45190]
MTIFLDTDTHCFIAHTRAELVDALLEHLDPETVDLSDLATACLGVTPLDVMLVED